MLRDPKGFVLTGRDVVADAAYPRIWKERREPLALETSAPGVFAAGDGRAGAMNRVARQRRARARWRCDRFTTTWR